MNKYFIFTFYNLKSVDFPRKILQLGHEWVISFQPSMQKGIKQHPKGHPNMTQIQASHCIALVFLITLVVIFFPQLWQLDVTGVVPKWPLTKTKIFIYPWLNYFTLISPFLLVIIFSFDKFYQVILNISQ